MNFLKAGARTFSVPVGATVLLALATLWLLQNGFSAEQALASAGRALVFLQLEDGQLGRMALLHPDPILFALLPLHLLWPGLHALAPYAISSLLVAALLAVFHRRLRADSGAGVATLLTLGCLAHPLLLWSASTGGSAALSLLLYYLACAALLQLRDSPLAHNYMKLGLLLALLCLADVRGLYLALALMPLLPLVVQPRVLVQTAAGAVLLVYTPLLLVLLSWLYLTSIYTSEPLAYLVSSSLQGFARAELNLDPAPWLLNHGGELLQPLGIAGGILLLGFPLAAWFCLRMLAPGRPASWPAAITALSLPVLATGIATATQFARHPLHFLFLEVAALMAILTHAEWRPRSPLFTAALLLAGVAAILPWLRWQPDPELHRWWAAASGRSEPADGAQRSLATWSRRMDGLMIDDQLGYPLIAWRGDADNLVLASSAAFQKALGTGVLEAAWVAVPNPRQPGGLRDQINFRFPDFYDYGDPRYSLAYDDGAWRIYGRKPLPPGFTPALALPAH